LLEIYEASTDSFDPVAASTVFVEPVALFAAAICQAGMAALPEGLDTPNGLDPRPGRDGSGL